MEATRHVAACRTHSRPPNVQPTIFGSSRGSRGPCCRPQAGMQPLPTRTAPRPAPELTCAPRGVGPNAVRSVALRLAALLNKQLLLR